MDNQTSYDTLDTQMLQNLLLNADQSPDVHKGAISALARRSAYQRSTTVATILRSVLQHPARYDQDVMLALIDILATDPDSEATAAMIDILPAMLELGIDPKCELKADFREYFYTVLVGRQRENDLAIWVEMLPDLDAKTLVAAVLDPAAGALEAIEPLTLIDRLPEPSRTKALISVIAGVAHMGGDPNHVKKATIFITQSDDPHQLQEGVNVLAQHYEKAKKAGRKAQTQLLESALAYH